MPLSGGGKPQSRLQRLTLVGLLVTVGIVIGDIGTSTEYSCSAYNSN